MIFVTENLGIFAYAKERLTTPSLDWTQNLRYMVYFLEKKSKNLERKRSKIYLSEDDNFLHKIIVRGR